ncbi:MAG: hypothetical protein M3535_07310 [Actinomycetota bacterium]|nr:hypothetical protein [Actinomycetota bacterium]
MEAGRHPGTGRRQAAERRAEGKSAKEIIRCLKRYVAREVFRLLTDPPPVLQGSDLRAARTKVGVSLAIVATALDSWPTRISELERGIRHDADLASRYETWLAQPKADLTSSHP